MINMAKQVFSDPLKKPKLNLQVIAIVQTKGFNFPFIRPTFKTSEVSPLFAVSTSNSIFNLQIIILNLFFSETGFPFHNTKTQVI